MPAADAVPAADDADAVPAADNADAVPAAADATNPHRYNAFADARKIFSSLFRCVWQLFHGLQRLYSSLEPRFLDPGHFGT